MDRWYRSIPLEGEAQGFFAPLPASIGKARVGQCGWVGGVCGGVWVGGGGWWGGAACGLAAVPPPCSTHTCRGLTHPAISDAPPSRLVCAAAKLRGARCVLAGDGSWVLPHEALTCTNEEVGGWESPRRRRGRVGRTEKHEPEEEAGRRGRPHLGCLLRCPRRSLGPSQFSPLNRGRCAAWSARSSWPSLRACTTCTPACAPCTPRRRCALRWAWRSFQVTMAGCIRVSCCTYAAACRVCSNRHVCSNREHAARLHAPSPGFSPPCP